MGLEIDRECVARYFIAEKWRRDPKPGAGPSMADNVARTVRWREEERVAVLGPADVARQAWNGYLYVNGTDRMGRPLIYYRPADQSAKKPEEAIRYLVYTLERALAAGRRNGGVEAYSFIIDCGGFSLQNMPPVHLIKQAFQLLHHHYPTRVGFICMRTWQLWLCVLGVLPAAAYTTTTLHLHQPPNPTHNPTTPPHNPQYTPARPSSSCGRYSTRSSPP